MDEFKAFSDSELLILIATGAEPAFRQLYDRYAAKVFHLSLNYLGSPFQAQDIVQEAFTRVWQKRAELPELHNFDAWLTTVTRNLLINQLQKKILLPLGGEAQSGPGNLPTDPGTRAEYRELEALVHKAVERLPERQREVYRLRTEDGLSHREIADRLGISYNTTREHMSKALGSIRDFVQQHYAYLVPVLYWGLIREIL